MHLEDEQIQRLLHGELSRSVETSVREHVTGCTRCRDLVGEAEREETAVFALLRSIDHPAPRIDAGAVASRARVRHVGWIRWAAGALLTLGLASAAYAAPGSPVPGWVEAIARWVAGDSAAEPDPRAGAGEGGEAAVAGVAVVPGREFVILFTSPQAEGQAQVSFTDSAAVVVRALHGAATFTSDADRLVIDNRGPAATFEIQIPRTAPLVEIQVDGSRIFLKEGSRVTTEASADPRGVYLVPLWLRDRKEVP
jgi:hypothetical protein